MYSIINRVKTRLRQFHIENDEVVYDHPEENPIIEECAKSNIAWFKNKLGKKFTDAELETFTDDYADIIVELTLYDLCVEGAEFQVTHSENGVNRTFRSKDEIFNAYGYYSYVKFLS